MSGLSNMTDYPIPDISALSEPYWSALSQGYLTFQRCACGHAWLPPREECPRCLLRQPQWERAGGNGRLLSWVVYRMAYHPAFKDRLPYVVAVVELDEGPRLITNIVPASSALAIDMPVRLKIEQENGIALARFKPIVEASGCTGQ